MTRPKIISLGEVLWDLFPDGARFGGAPANFACHAAILGGDVSMVSAVGNDDRGRQALEILGGCGIDLSLTQTVSDAPTGTVGIQLDANGKPTFTIHENSAWDQLAWNESIESGIMSADAVYFGTLGQRSPQTRQTIRQSVAAAQNASIPRIVDINLRAPFFDDELIRTSVRGASILKLSDDELPNVCSALDIDRSGSTDSQLNAILRAGQLDWVVMTRGAEGAVLVGPEGSVSQAGIKTTVRDTVGAGDSFTAAFLTGLLRGDPHCQILENACRVAANVCAHVGAVPEQIRDSAAPEG